VPGDVDDHEELRPQLYSIDYRKDASVPEAEDLVQEAFLRYHRAVADGADVEAPKAYLAAATTRLAIDHLRSARVRRERYVGQWLPEPLVSDRAPDVAQRAEAADSLSLALLVVLESLSPVERAVFLLREVFDYGYGEIAEVIGRSEANTRQLAVRARRHVDERRPRFAPSAEQRDELGRRFFAAVEEGDTEALVALLADDVTAYGDGGGKAPAAARPVQGRDRVAQFLAGLGKQGELMRARLVFARVNGDPGLVALDPADRVIAVVGFEIGDGVVTALRSQVNPDKLGHLGEVADVRALLRAGLRSRDSRPGPSASTAAG
jgi:RNA polymerase sigma-70 factor (ECF subfamily)